jgi:hypothetical protein
MFGGTSARRKFGGPDIYKVPIKALSAGLANGKSTLKLCCRKEDCTGSCSSL